MTPTDDGKPPEHLSGDERRLWEDAVEHGSLDLVMPPAAVLALLSEVAWLRGAVKFYAALGPDDVPYADTINDPPDIGRVARAALER